MSAPNITITIDHLGEEYAKDNLTSLRFAKKLNDARIPVTVFVNNAKEEKMIKALGKLEFVSLGIHLLETKIDPRYIARRKTEVNSVKTNARLSRTNANKNKTDKAAQIRAKQVETKLVNAVNALKKAEHIPTKAEQSKNIQLISKKIYDLTGKMPTTASYHGYRAGPDPSRIDLTGLRITGQDGKELPIVIRAVRGISGSSHAATDQKSRHTNATKGVKAGSVMEPLNRSRCNSPVIPNIHEGDLLDKRIKKTAAHGQVASFFFHSNQLVESHDYRKAFDELIRRSSPLSPSTKIYKAIPFHQVYGPGACK